MRVFFAINLPTKIQAEIDKLNKNLQKKLPKANWVKKENIHLTIKFVGDVNNNELRLLEVTAEKIIQDKKQFSVDIKNLSLFPASHPRVVSLGLESDDLINFAESFIKQIDRIDFVKAEQRGWLPHITLARIKENFESEHFEVIEQSKYESSFKVKSLDLMSSELTPQGPMYKVVKSFPL